MLCFIFLLTDINTGFQNSEKRVACDVIVLSEFLGYFNCLYSQISMETPSEPSEETIMKTFMLLDTGSRSKNETNKRKTSSGLPRHHQDHIDMKYCTFKSTGNSELLLKSFATR